MAAEGSLVFPGDLPGPGRNGPVDLTLSRLTKKGILRRVDREEHDYPEKNRLTGGPHLSRRK